MKYNRIKYLLIPMLITFGACNNETKQEVKNEADNLGEKVTQVVDTVKADIVENREKNFVQDVVKANANELHQLLLAQKRSASKSIKSAARSMEADHKKLGESFANYAAAKNINIAADTSDLDHEFDDKAAGASWDKQWVDKIVTDHEKTVKKFEDASTDVKDPQLKEMIDKALPILRVHWDMARNIQNKMDAATK